MINVKINGKRIRGFDEFEMRGENAHQSNNYPSNDRTPALRVTLSRNVAIEPLTAGFAFIANDDGAVVPIKLEMDVLKPTGGTNYSITLDNAYLESWRQVATTDGTLREEWVITSWKVSMESDGRRADFERDEKLVPN